MRMRLISSVAIAALTIFTASFAAHAASSTAKVANDPVGGYRAMKAALLNVYQSSGWPEHSEYKLIPCSTIGSRTSLPPSYDPQFYDFMESWAQIMLMIERKLQTAGYPSSVWRQPLFTLEQSVLNRIAATPASQRQSLSLETALGDGGRSWQDNPELVALLQALSRYRITHPNLEEIHEGGECGDGDITMRIEVSPPGARTWFLVEFHYRLCKAQGIDPLDVNQCDRWVEAVTDVIALAGDYRYLAVWPDGTRRTGLLKLNGKQFSGTPIYIRR